jgi:hypothetical protein
MNAMTHRRQDRPWEKHGTWWENRRRRRSAQASSSGQSNPVPIHRVGRDLWRSLHNRAWEIHSEGDNKNWLVEFEQRVPHFGCRCRDEWRELQKLQPPPLDAPANMFAWTVSIHDAINAKLGKPLFGLDAARQRWRLAWQLTEEELKIYFDAVYCINLDKDSTRWEEFQKQLAASQWPFRPVTRIGAIHGDTVGVPDYFHQGGGAWGCLQSHRRVLEQSLMAGHERILVMEDDADIRPWFSATAARFLADLEDRPWDCLMLGGQHMAPPQTIKPGLVRASAPGGIQRTHCMAFSRSFMRELYRRWSGPLDQHCDWSLGPFAAGWQTFAPEKFIVGQRGGNSHITGRAKPPEWWNPPRAGAPVVWLRCPRPVLEACRDIFHAGYRRNDDGICVGLADVFDSAKNPTPPQQIAALQSWISMIQWEVESRGDGSLCTIWHPAARQEIIQAAAGSFLFEVDALTEQQARTGLAGLTPPPAQ